MIQAFWRDEPLNSKELDLLEALFEGHRAAALRQNISSVVLQAAYQGSGDFNKAVAAAICTLGGTHAPIEQAYEWLEMGWPIHGILLKGQRVPGWGNSFVKGKHDPIWDRTRDYIGREFPMIDWGIGYITEKLHNHGRNVYPNAACYTAATAKAIGMPKEISPMLVHCARIETWAELIYDITRKAPKD